MPLKLPDRFPNIAIELPVAVAFASGVCASILAVVLLAYSFNSEPVKSSAAAPPAEKQAGEKPTVPEPSRVLGSAQPQDASCENQTWPYIDQRCLTPAPPKERAAAASKPGGGSLSSGFEVRPETPDNKATVRTVAPASTDGMASASDRAVSPPAPAAKPVTSVLPDRPMAVTGEPAMRPQTTLATVESPMPARAAPAAVAKASEVPTTPRRKAKDSRRSRDQTAGLQADDPNRIVRRWREVEYQGPGGETRKVIYVRPGTLQRDGYFATAR